MDRTVFPVISLARRPCGPQFKFSASDVALVAGLRGDYNQCMKTLTVQEATQGLSGWLRRAASGEHIAIHEGNCTVLLQPLPHGMSAEAERLPPRKALEELQSKSHLTPAAAEKYLREIREERMADGLSRGL
jgi:antitoxin (DNA-binding transcriptional repressor) of toxin-antitoxin stability system